MVKITRAQASIDRTLNYFNKKLVSIYTKAWSQADKLTDDNHHWEAVLHCAEATKKIINHTQLRLYRMGKYEQMRKLEKYFGIVAFMTDYIETEIIGNNKRGFGTSDSASKQVLCWKNINNILRQCVLADKEDAGEFGKLVEERIGLND